ncbi:MAG: hypothetical protein AB2L14_21660 [Candidatus Xenobiia bacterium LiM19]
MFFDERLRGGDGDEGQGVGNMKQGAGSGKQGWWEAGSGEQGAVGRWQEAGLVGSVERKWRAGMLEGGKVQKSINMILIIT